MPWNPNFNFVLGGAAGGGLAAGRNASFAEILAGAAMGSTEMLDRLEERKRQLAELEERRRLEAEDRAMRLEERDMRMKAERERLASIARQDEAGRVRDQFAREHSDPNFMGPLQDEPPPTAFPEPGDYAQWDQGRDALDAKAQEEQKIIQFILEKGGTPGPTPEINREIVKSLLKGSEGGLTPYQQLQESHYQDREEEDYSNWQTKFVGDLEQSRPAVLDAKRAEDWQRAFAKNFGDLVKDSDSLKKSEEDLQETAKRITEIQMGPRPGQFGTTPKPKAPPLSTQPVNPDLAGALPPRAAPVASPTGATAPPSPSGNRTLATNAALGQQISAAMPGAPPEKVAQAKQMIWEALKNGQITKAELPEAIAQLRAQYSGWQSSFGQ
jgi:hypothetical protein